MRKVYCRRVGCAMCNNVDSRCIVACAVPAHCHFQLSAWHQQNPILSRDACLATVSRRQTSVRQLFFTNSSHAN